MSFGAPPVIPTELRQYNSYVEDPKWQRKFSIIWASALAAFVLLSVPHVARTFMHGRLFRGQLTGVMENDRGKYSPAASVDTVPPRNRRRVMGIIESLRSTILWSLPGIELNAGQMLVIGGYLVLVIACITMNAVLIENPNRAGFLAIAQFPVVFLFATKNSILSLLLGPGNGYEKLNWVHRWAGRGMFIGAVVHGSLWINNHIVFDMPILGQQKETSGVAAFALLCIIIVTSIRPVRRYFYETFFIVHVLAFVAFFITMCYHTIYASPWIFPPLAFYGMDMLLRMFRYRIKDATLVPVDGNMTLIHIHNSDDGWLAGQHVRLRVFFSGRLFESHPLTITNAPGAGSCLPGGTITLGARVRGDWTRELNAYATAEQHRLACGGKNEKDANPGIPVQVMIDGPYGGCSVDLGDYESALLVAGGSGVTFTLGLLDDIVARCARLGRPHGEKTRRIEFVWCVRSYGCIRWFAPAMIEIANTAANTSLDLHFSIFVTCLCDPESVPSIPNMDVVASTRPSVTNLLRDVVKPPPARPSSDEISVDGASIDISTRLNWVGLGGGVALCAAGPESMTREATNAAARLGVTRGVELGGIGLHTELYAI